MPLIEANGIAYHSVAEKVFNAIGWLCLGLSLIAITALVVGAETNAEHGLLILVGFSWAASWFARLRIQYYLTSDSFIRVVTPAFVFGLFNRSVNFKEKKFNYIFLTRSSGSIQRTGYSPESKFYIEITYLKQSGLIVNMWNDLISLFECFNSTSAADVYRFALQVQVLTSLEIVIDPAFYDLYKKEIPSIK